MNKKNFSMIGMVVSLVVALCGILTMAGVMGGDASSANSAPYYYDSGYASFGADFYGYVTNNAAEAADAAQATASNLVDIADLLRNVCGIFLMGFGLMGFAGFGYLWCGFKKEKPVAVVPEAADAVLEEQNVAESEEESVEEVAVEFPEEKEEFIDSVKIKEIFEEDVDVEISDSEEVK